MRQPKKISDKHRRARDIQEREPGKVAWITNQRSNGRIKAGLSAPPSYLVETPRSIIRDNRSQLHPSFGQLLYDQDIQRKN
ncbi:hypothetical protein HNY73_004639 [Argiope bruennichi]|uniref:Uncharacterized protein n=1 Tax=Argiope bruennichi TaxID=94029 RepID=A0A8T0FQL6_ARGBR|nr:hypothetical protein HNY73_004639 [Argiope bruennichi]